MTNKNNLVQHWTYSHVVQPPIPLFPASPHPLDVAKRSSCWKSFCASCGCTAALGGPKMAEQLKPGRSPKGVVKPFLWWVILFYIQTFLKIVLFVVWMFCLFWKPWEKQMLWNHGTSLKRSLGFCSIYSRRRVCDSEEMMTVVWLVHIDLISYWWWLSLWLVNGYGDTASARYGQGIRFLRLLVKWQGQVLDVAFIDIVIIQVPQVGDQHLMTGTSNDDLWSGWKTKENNLFMGIFFLPSQRSHAFRTWIWSNEFIPLGTKFLSNSELMHCASMDWTFWSFVTTNGHLTKCAKWLLIVLYKKTWIISFFLCNVVLIAPGSSLPKSWRQSVPRWHLDQRLKSRRRPFALREGQSSSGFQALRFLEMAPLQRTCPVWPIVRLEFRLPTNPNDFQIVLSSNQSVFL